MTYILDRFCESSVSYDNLDDAVKAALQWTLTNGMRSRVFHAGLLRASFDVTNGQLVSTCVQYADWNKDDSSSEVSTESTPKSVNVFV